MVVQLEIDGSYGWVLIVFATSVVVHNLVFGRFVGKARMKYKINFPIMYADPKECENAQAFNCIQRGHQNALEFLASHLALLLVVGLKYPRLSALAGAVYLVGRVRYFQGYSTGKPGKRRQGFFGFLGLLTHLALAVFWGGQLILSTLL